MNAETKAALEASIRHWEDNVANWQGFINRLLTEDGYTYHQLPIFNSDCALCDMYYYNGCEGCPLDTAGQNCNVEDSPWANLLYTTRTISVEGTSNVEASYDAARKMLQTLKDLNHD